MSKETIINQIYKVKEQFLHLQALLFAWPDKQEEIIEALDILDDWIEGLKEES